MSRRAKRGHLEIASCLAMTELESAVTVVACPFPVMASSFSVMASEAWPSQDRFVPRDDGERVSWVGKRVLGVKGCLCDEGNEAAVCMGPNRMVRDSVRRRAHGHDVQCPWCNQQLDPASGIDLQTPK